MKTKVWFNTALVNIRYLSAYLILLYINYFVCLLLPIIDVLLSSDNRNILSFFHSYP